MGLRSSIGRGLNLAGDVAGAVGQAAGAVGQAVGAVGQAGLGLAQAATTVPEGGVRSPLGRFASIIQGGAAGFAGRPDLAPLSDAQVRQQQAQQAQQALQQFNAQFQTLKNTVSIIKQLPKDRQQAATDALTPRIASTIPNGEVLLEAMLGQPTIAEGLEQAFEGDPVFEQLLEIDPTGGMAQQFITSEQGIDYITRLGNFASQGKLVERLPDVVDFVRSNLPEEFARIEKGGITLEELRSVNDALPEELKLSPGLIASAEDRPDLLLQFGLTLPELDRRIRELEGFDDPTFNDAGDLIQRNSKTNQVKILRSAAAGAATPEQKASFRRDFRNASGEFVKVRDAFDTLVSASEGGAAGDLALIFAFMKMIDPGSTVREGEFATVQNSAGVSDRIRALHNNFLKGERFGSVEQRQSFVDQARKILAGRVKRQVQLEKTFQTYAKADGVDTTVGGALIADFIGEERELIAAPERQRAAEVGRAAQAGERKLPTDEDIDRVISEIGSSDNATIGRALQERGFRLE